MKTKKSGMAILSAVFLAASMISIPAQAGSDGDSVRAECAPYITGKTSIDRQAEYSRANWRGTLSKGSYVGPYTIAAIFGLLGAPAAVPSLGATEIPAVALTAVGAIDHHLFSKIGNKADKEVVCLEAVYPDEFPQTNDTSVASGSVIDSKDVVIVNNTIEKSAPPAKSGVIQ